MFYQKNKITLALSVLGVLSILQGIILGVYFGSSNIPVPMKDIQLNVGWSVLKDGVVWGIVFFGFAEVIKLLQGIYDQHEPSKSIYENNISNQEETSKTIDQTQSLKHVSDATRQEIIDYLGGQFVEEIEQTKVEDIYVVKMSDKVIYIELGGFKPFVLSDNRIKALKL